VGVKALKAIADKHPVIPLILEYKKLTKLITSYTESLIEKVAEDGRVHPSFLQTGTETGRLSSNNPNGQQIPKHTEEGKKLRKAFKAAEGHVLVAFDYSQIELRVLAHYSQDPLLMKAFREGKDIHQAVADELGIERRIAKAVNFGLVYGSTEFGLARTLLIPTEEAKRYIDNYFLKYRGVYYWMQRQKAQARQDGYTVTMFGRKRKLTGLDSRDKFVRAAAERMALNTPIQGTAAEIMKVGMIKVFRYITKECNGVKSVLQIHDDLTLECSTPVNVQYLMNIKRLLETAVKLDVPLLTEMVQGINLGDMK
jgi:DNA polymerase-1